MTMHWRRTDTLTSGRWGPELQFTLVFPETIPGSAPKILPPKRTLRLRETGQWIALAGTIRRMTLRTPLVLSALQFPQLSVG